MKRFFFMTAMAVAATFYAFSQNKPATPQHTDTIKPKVPVTSAPKSGPKPYKEVITDKAVTCKGLFTVHKVEERWFFEIPDSLLKREIMAITRFSKTAGGGVYGGELANQQVLQWEKGPNNTVFLRVVILVNMADSTNKIYKAITNSNVNPIAASFDIKAFGKDSVSSIIDVTDFFKGDNLVVSIPPSVKSRMKLGGLAGDRSYIDHISTFPINTEVRTVKTFTVGGGPSMPFGLSFNSPTDAAGASTLELNTSFILLPGTPMKKRPVPNNSPNVLFTMD